MQMLRTRIQALFNQALDTVLPPRCVVSGEAVERQGMIGAQAWNDLDFISRPFCEVCGFPFGMAVDEGMLCASCLENPPPFSSARSALKYNDSSRDLILGFKHADKMHAVLAFIPWLRNAGEDMLRDADLIVPVPLHHFRLISRRYNQAALIAQQLSVQSDIPVLIDSLRRVRATRSQGHLKMRERFKNVRKAFAVFDRDVPSIEGKVIVLVDDVYTTGATLRECTQVLLKAGAKEVHALTLARVAREE